MNIKSLLLGSAAALVAVSGARAADAVVMVEPEPMEYVRVCDTYGTGFFYIPGTETCLKVGGYVRMRLNASGDVNDVDLNQDDNLDQDADDYDFNTQVRARIDFDAREETELGMLRAFVRLQATNISGNTTAGTTPVFLTDADNNLIIDPVTGLPTLGLDGTSEAGFGTSANDVIIDQAFIQLGGLTAGKLDSLWAERDGLFTDNDWSVGDFSANRISYTFAVAGFTAAVSVEDEGDGDALPDVVGQLAYSGGWGEAYISGVYDEDSVGVTQFAFDDFDDDDAEDGAFVLKAGVTLKDLIATGSQLKVEGHYAFDPSVYASLAPGGYLLSNQVALEDGIGFTDQDISGLPSEWQIGAAYQQQFDKLFAAVSGVYGETFDINFINAAGNVDDDSAEYFGGAVNVGYNLTTNFSVLGEVSYRDVDLPVGDDLDQTRGFLEFKRTF